MLKSESRLRRETADRSVSRLAVSMTFWRFLFMRMEIWQWFQY
ncbi:hypothetical protein [Chamaesiphon sp.]